MLTGLILIFDCFNILGRSWRSGTRCDCKTDWLWVRSPLEEMKYLLKFIFHSHSIPFIVPTFCRILEELRVEWQNSTPRFASTPERCHFLEIFTHRKKKCAVKFYPFHILNLSVDYRKQCLCQAMVLGSLIMSSYWSTFHLSAKSRSGPGFCILNERPPSKWKM